VAFSSELGGYHYAECNFNLPGLWFSEPELYSLLVMHSLLERLQPGVVREQLEPFEARLRALLDKPAPGVDSVLERMHVLPRPQRPVDPQHFQAICDSTLRRKKLRLRYYARYRGVESDRTVSPQRVIYYRGNWYLDAWCDDKKAVRRFAVDAVRAAGILDEAAINIEGNGDGSSGYGIFSGAAAETAVLLFDAEAAKWVAEEEWHPRQRVQSMPDGSVQLEVQYSHPREILMDILRHGAHVEVLQPAALRNAVAEAHREAAAKYAVPKQAVASAGSAAGARPARLTQA
jgi:predicted DNA-binding transcriptional regulator YafY